MQIFFKIDYQYTNVDFESYHRKTDKQKVQLSLE